MADQPTTPSGNRWEPDPDETPTTDSSTDSTAAPETPGPPAPPAAEPYGVLPDDALGTLDEAATEERRAHVRSRSILVGAAVALALGGGLTGYVIGHSTAGHDTVGFQPANFSGQQGGEGQQGPPTFRDGDGDGDGDHGFGQPPQDFGGDSSGSSSSNSSTGTGT